MTTQRQTKREARRAEQEYAERKAHLEAEIHRVRAEVVTLRLVFNQTTESELIDECVFEMNALNARYAYHMRKLKELYREDTRVSFADLADEEPTLSYA